MSGCGSWPEQSSGRPLASLTLVERGVEEISSPHPPCRRGGGGEDKGLFPNATTEAGASREDALNCCLLSALPGKIIDGAECPEKQRAD